MRILHLLASPFYSGPAEAVARLAVAQRERGHEVSVAVDVTRAEFAAEEPAAPRFEALELLDRPADGAGVRLSVRSTAGMVRDAWTLRRRRVDVVHCHFSHDHWVAALGRPPGATLVRSLHAARSIRRWMPPADGWTVPVAAWMPKVEGRGPVAWLPPVVDPMFVPSPDREAERRALTLQGCPIIGMVSTFQASRRHDVGVEAFQRLHKECPAARLVLVGDGGMEAQVRVDVRRRGLESAVTFAGYRSGEEFARFLRCFDTVWILGLGNDGAGRAAAQARACGVQVVAVDAGGLPDWADVTVPVPAVSSESSEPTVRAVVEATERATRRRVEVPAPHEIADGMLELYRRSKMGRRG